MGYYYMSTWSESIHVHDAGIVTCEVEDIRGKYTAEKDITLFPNETSDSSDRLQPIYIGLTG